MSTLRAATLSNVAGTGSPDITGGELSRTRINFNGTGTIAVRDSFNVSSITDLGAGYYRINFTIASPVADYSAIVNAPAASNGTNTCFMNINAILTTNFDVFNSPSGTGAGGSSDSNLVVGACFGDKP